jgi:phosphoglycerate dehydrogenase-like enzyme
MMNSKPVLVYSGPLAALADLKAMASPCFEVVRVRPEPTMVASALERATAFLDASLKVRIDAAMIQAAAALKVVAVAATGSDHVSEEALRARGIPLFSLKGQTEVLRELTPAAEHSWLLLMASARRLRAAQEHVLAGGWNGTDFPGIMLKGKTLGLIGCGRIGTWMSRYAHAFGMTCLGYDPYVAPWPAGIQRTTVDNLLTRADFVSLHVPLLNENVGMFGRQWFERMKPGAIFINTSRGALIDEEALLEALESGRLAAAALDVLQGEPDVETHPLRQYAVGHSNLIITPHIGGRAPEAVCVAVRHTAERVLRYVRQGIE